MISFSDDEDGTRVQTRLRDDMIAWLTHVDGVGQPQPAPVWFLWNPSDGTALIYCQPTANRLTRISENPRASLSLTDDGAGHDFAVLAGTISRANDVPPGDAHPPYVEKYGQWMDNTFGSHAAFTAAFSVPITFTALRVRGHGRH